MTQSNTPTANSCRAKNTATCRYHGSTKNSITTQLRANLVLAHSGYVGSYAKDPTSPDTYASYASLRESQKQYYATDEGIALLDSYLIAKTGDQIQVEDLKREAISFRRETEMREGGSEWSEPVKTLDVFPILNENPPVRGIHDISSIVHEDGSITNYMWDEKSRNVYIEGIEADGSPDYDEMRDIGKADTRDQAIFRAYDWWRLRA